MSLTSAVGRVAELETMLAGPAANAAPAAAAEGFQEQLLKATGGAQAPGSVASAGLAGGAGATPYDAEIQAAAARHGIDPALLKGLIRQESGFDPRAGSSAGAQGLTQLMPATARGLGVTDPFDPAQSIDGGARYLRQQLDAFGGDVTKALAAYNAGPEAVKRYGGVPPYAETQNYVKSVQAFAEQYRVAAQAPSALAATPTTAALGAGAGLGLAAGLGAPTSLTAAGALGGSVALGSSALDASALLGTTAATAPAQLAGRLPYSTV